MRSAVWAWCGVLAAACVYGDFDKIADRSDSSGGRAPRGGSGGADGGSTSAGQIGAAGAAEGGTAGQASFDAGSPGVGGSDPGDAGAENGGGSGESAGGSGGAPGACAAVIACVSGDGCCPEDCNRNLDADCPSKCGNGAEEGNEKCDGDCPTSCDDGDACTVHELIGSARNCNAQCRLVDTITACVGGDGCCPGACNANNDSDCSASCGNGTREAGETCDPCSAQCDDGNVCTSDTPSGSVENCTFVCTYAPVTCQCSTANGCLAGVTGVVSSPQGFTSGSDAATIDGDPSTELTAGFSNPQGGTAQITTTITFGPGTTIDSIELVAHASASASNGFANASVAVDIHYTNGSARSVFRSGSGNNHSVNRTIDGPWNDVASLTVYLSASAESESYMGGYGSVSHAETRIFGSGAWALTPPNP